MKNDFLRIKSSKMPSKFLLIHLYQNKILYNLMLNIQPTLIGKLVKLRPLMPEDLQPLYKAASDPLIWDQHPQPLRYQRQYFIQHFFNGAIACKGAFLISTLEDDVMGSTRFYNYRQSHKDIMIGYSFTSRNYWGGLYNREIKHLLLTYIYQSLDIVYFTVGANNLRSRKAMTKIGGVLLTPQQIKEKQLSISTESVVFQIEKKNFHGLI